MGGLDLGGAGVGIRGGTTKKAKILIGFPPQNLILEPTGSPKSITFGSTWGRYPIPGSFAMSGHNTRPNKQSPAFTTGLNPISKSLNQVK